MGLRGYYNSIIYNIKKHIIMIKLNNQNPPPPHHHRTEATHTHTLSNRFAFT
ncbi:predicted protein [Botrytis cinerea T4]|uniref:Uncharacterized protein n=1 Tax=Botryotinia fuckeliana (strain T4) TaxID=999810 RepID=G2Y3K7_BOTF4|nr:predicted protein [Botrytis cinerea T4]